MNKKNHFAFGCFAATLGLFASKAMAADPGHLTVNVDKPGAKLPPMFYGLMTEEINYSYDGGLYGELIQNRIFKDPAKRVGRAAPDSDGIPHWAVVTAEGAKAQVALDTTVPINNTALTTALRLDISAADKDKRAGVSNDGYWGIPIKPDTFYKCSFYAKSRAPFAGSITVDIESSDGATIHASSSIPRLTDQWKKYELTLKTGDVTPAPNGRFVVSANTTGTVWLDLVSLFPPTYKNRPNGFRPDIMDLLAGLQPNFLRFPGGNYLEGPNYENRFNFKTTLGPYEDRPGHLSPWNYRSSDGMGLLEFLKWCEDLKMEPVLAVYDGLHIDGGKNIITGDALKPHVQDALDEIEYATGDAKTRWGAQRLKDGHPAPFHLTYVEIGNEDWLNKGTSTYDARYTMFHDAIRAKYPNLKLIATINNVKTRNPDVVDDHLYASVAKMELGATNYDKHPRNGSKIFMGEWASQEGKPTPDLNSALGDAAFLSGLERNCDLVVMQCYAPLLVNVNPGGSQWGTNLIGYNSLHSFGSPSYYAQKMFSVNRGDTLLPIDITPQSVPLTPAPQPGRNPPEKVPPLIGNAFRVDATGEVIIKLVNTADIPQVMEIKLAGVKSVEKTATAEILTGKPGDVNSIADPEKIVPHTVNITDAGARFTYEFVPYSVTVIRLKTK